MSLPGGPVRQRTWRGARAVGGPRAECEVQRRVLLDGVRRPEAAGATCGRGRGRADDGVDDSGGRRRAGLREARLPRAHGHEAAALGGRRAPREARRATSERVT